MPVTYSSSWARRQAISTVREFDEELRALQQAPKKRRLSWLRTLGLGKRDGRPAGGRPTTDETRSRFG
jgi:hypothetical protein